MRWANNGNVGIGTTAPGAKLDVRGTPGQSTYLAYMYNSASHTQAHGLNVQIASSGAAAYGLRVNTGGDSNALAVMGNGKVGIGTSAPGAKLSVYNGVISNYQSIAGVAVGLAFENNDTSNTAGRGTSIVFGSGSYNYESSGGVANAILAEIRGITDLASDYKGALSFHTGNYGSSERMRITSDGTQNHQGNRIVNSQTVNDLHRTAEPSLRFDGVDDKVTTTGVVFTETEPWSYGFTCKKQSITQGDPAVFIQNTGNGGIVLYNATVSFRASGSYATAVNITYLDKWTSLFFVADGDGSIKVYQDGVEIGDLDVSGLTGGSGTTFSGFSCNANGSPNWVFEGECREFSLHNRAFSAADVAAAYNGESTPWKYDDANPTGLAVASAANPDDEANSVGNFYARNNSAVSSSTTTWTGSSGTYSIKAVITASNSGIWGNKTGESGATGAGSSAVPDGTLTIGRRYRVSYSINNVDISASITQELFTGTTSVESKNFLTTGIHNHSVEFTANGTSLYFALVTGDNGQTRTLYLDNWKLVEIGEVAAYTPQSITSGEWRDTTSNANHGAITGATMVGSHNVGGAVIQGSTTDPVITTNPADEGHIWVNTTSGAMYICRDNTTNLNVWQSLTHESEDIVPATRFSGAYDFFGDGSAKALWQFDGTAVDTGGNYDGEVQAGVSLIPGRQAMYGTKMADFQGTGSIIIPFIANTFRRTDAFTISFWLTRKGTLPVNTLPFTFNASSANKGRGANIVSSLCMRQSTSAENSMAGAITAFGSADGDHFVVVGNTDTTTTLYRNGSLHATSAAATSNHTNVSGGYGGEIGSRSDSYNPTEVISSMNYYDCSVDQFRIFNKAVTSTEVTELYNEGA
jgi:hypothetical protein